MNWKTFMKNTTTRLKALWDSKKIQRSFRILYDVSWNVILFFLVIGFIGLFFAGGIGAGYFASLVKDEPIRDYENMEKQIYDYEETSKLYFADDIYFGNIRSDLHREEVSLDNVSDILINAVIATEDREFYEHKGVVPKAIVRAVVQEATNANIKTGGSTLTQQLIKNQILTNEVSFDRKAKEILLALRLEGLFEKEQILEAYLNIIPYGREASGSNIAGVQTAAQGIFGVDADVVTLPQAAYLAGLPQSPSTYTPFVNTGGLKDDDGLQPGINRMKTVLRRMYESDFINEKQYKDALTHDIVSDFTEKTTSPIESYPHLTYALEDEAKEILTEILIEKDGYTMEDLENDENLKKQYKILVDRDLRVSGYNIYSTINKDIYDVMQPIAKEYAYYGPNRTVTERNKETGEIEKEWNEQVQTGSVLIENNTGRIISFVGGREFNQDNQVNFAFDTERSNGSTMKPLLDYAPAMEKGIVQPGTPVADYERSYPISGQKPYKPRNYGGGYYGIVSAREALAKSHNIPAIEIYSRFINENPAKEYLQKMGFSSLEPVDYGNLSLALGGLTNGVTVEENTNAFATFGNGGKFVDSYMIDKITTHDGKVIYEHETKPVEIFSPQTNYLTLDMMRDVIRNGTATYLQSQIKHNVDWVGKTGTSNDYQDAWFVGVNQNVTFGTWIGYETPHDLMNSCSGCPLSYSQRVNKLWAELINAASDIDPELIAPKERFKRPEGIVERSYCAISGMLPSKLCKKAGLVKTDLFNSKYVPTKEDDSLITGSYVTVNGKAVIAGSNTPKEFIEGDGLTFNPAFLKREGYDKLNDISQLYPRNNRDLWEKISVPSDDLGDELKDDGKAPKPPKALKESDKVLSWEKSDSKDVVGYYVYYAPRPGDKFKLVSNTSDTKINFTESPAVVHIKAVDYFGLESEASKEITIGEFPDEKEKEKKEKEKEKEKKKEKENKNENKQEKQEDQKEKRNNQSKNKNKNDRKDND